LKTGDVKIMALCREFKKFDNLKDLIPQNNLVTQQDIIPGLLPNKFPAPIMDPKTADKQQVPTIRKSKLMYIHNIQIIANP